MFEKARALPLKCCNACAAQVHSAAKRVREKLKFTQSRQRKQFKESERIREGEAA